MRLVTGSELHMTISGGMGRWGFVSILLLAGCGSGVVLPDLVEVKGKVTMGGQPVSEARVTFEPTKSGGMSSGVTDAEGNFRLTYAGNVKGAVPGEHLVRISKLDGEAGPEMLPPAYNSNSGLKQEVTKAGPNDFTFDLKSAKK